MNLSWIITKVPVDKTIQINVFLGLFCLILTGLYYMYKSKN
jgi:hypothetical protein